MKRAILFSSLFLLYVAVLIGRSGWLHANGTFDPLQPRPREVERAVAAHRFADALPGALDLRKAFPREPLVVYWLASIYQGLNRPSDEAASWALYQQLSSAPEEACPRIAQVYEQMGNRTRALAEYERCSELDASNPDRFVDLGDAAVRLGDRARALTAFEHAQALDPSDPAVAERMRRLSSVPGD